MSAAKAKGTRWETSVRDFLNATLFSLVKIYRPAQEGFRDVGDLHGLPGFVIQCKDWRDWQSAIREGLDGAVTQAGNAGETYGIAVVKRARKPVGDAYVVMRLSDFAEMQCERLSN